MRSALIICISHSTMQLGSLPASTITSWCHSRVGTYIHMSGNYMEVSVSVLGNTWIHGVKGTCCRLVSITPKFLLLGRAQISLRKVTNTLLLYVSCSVSVSSLYMIFLEEVGGGGGGNCQWALQSARFFKVYKYVYSQSVGDMYYLLLSGNHLQLFTAQHNYPHPHLCHYWTTGMTSRPPSHGQNAL